jgi:hypothetical protein
MPMATMQRLRTKPLKQLLEIPGSTLRVAPE